MLLAWGSGKASAVAAEVAVAGTGFGAVPVFYASPLSSSSLNKFGSLLRRVSINSLRDLRTFLTEVLLTTCESDTLFIAKLRI